MNITDQCFELIKQNAIQDHIHNRAAFTFVLSEQATKMISEERYWYMTGINLIAGGSYIPDVKKELEKVTSIYGVTVATEYLDPSSPYLITCGAFGLLADGTIERVHDGNH